MIVFLVSLFNVKAIQYSLTANMKSSTSSGTHPDVHGEVGWANQIDRTDNANEWNAGRKVGKWMGGDSLGKPSRRQTLHGFRDLLIIS